MDKKKKESVGTLEDCKDWMKNHKHGHNHSGRCGVYGLGFLGALIYYSQSSVVFTDYVYAFLKALLWPAFLIYKVFTNLGM